MLDMGFEPQIRKTMYDIRPDRQTVMTRLVKMQFAPTKARIAYKIGSVRNKVTNFWM